MADYQEHLSQFNEHGAVVVALSTDDADSTRELVKSDGLAFPVLHSASAEKIVAATGAYRHARGFLQATAFVLKPDGTVALCVYSSGSRGRLVASDAVFVVGQVTG